MSVSHIILSSWLFVCQKLSNLVQIWRSSDKSKLGHFLDHPVDGASYATIYAI